MRVKQCFGGWARRALANACTTLLCLLVRRLFISLFVQPNDRCRKKINVPRLQIVEILCLRMSFFGSFPRYLLKLCKLCICDPMGFQKRLDHLWWIWLCVSVHRSTNKACSCHSKCSCIHMFPSPILSLDCGFFNEYFIIYNSYLVESFQVRVSTLADGAIVTS